MALGMTYDEYWHGDVYAARMYLEADRLRQKRKNEEAWLQGMYVYDALARVSPIFRAFALRGTKASPYPDKPYDIDGENKTKTDKAQAEKNEQLKARLFFENWARAAKKHFET